MDNWRLSIDEKFEGQILDPTLDAGVIRRTIRSKRDFDVPFDAGLTIDEDNDRSTAASIYGVAA